MAETSYNHQCLICAKKFKACNNCIKLKSFEEYEAFNMNDYCEKHDITEEQKHQMFLGFRSTCCEFNHYLIFGLIRQLKKQQITSQQAKIELENLGYTIREIQNFKESVKNYLLENVFKDENNMAEEPLNIESKVVKTEGMQQKYVSRRKRMQET